MDESSKIRARLGVGLVLAGAVAAAVAGVAITVLGKIVSGAPPATLANYARNMIAFGVLAAVVSPMVTWSAFRRVPLWRTIVEPLVAGIGGAALGVLLGSGVLFLALTPLAMAAAMVRLGRQFSDPRPLLPRA